MKVIAIDFKHSLVHHVGKTMEQTTILLELQIHGFRNDICAKRDSVLFYLSNHYEIEPIR